MTRTKGSFHAQFGVPSNVGVANAEGVAALFVRQDHVHNHPAGLGEDLHHAKVHGVAEHTDVTRSILIHPQGGNAVYEGVVNYWGGASLDDANDRWCDCTGKVPSDFVSVVHVHPVLFGVGTGDLYWAARGYVAAVGEDCDIDLNSKALAATAVTVKDITEIADVAASICPNLAAGDYFSLGFRRKGDDALDTIGADVLFIGFLLEYVANQ